MLQSQVKEASVDSLSYLEDQIYLSLTYNNLRNKPSSISQNGFSSGISAGFIKDIPLNHENNFGVGLGLGYGYNVYVQNLKISKENNVVLFEPVSDYKSNWLRLHSIDIPFEFRWRNSTLEKYKFWRIYTGLKASYIITSKSKYNNFEEVNKTKNISEINKIQYGLTLAAGYGTWNLFIYYGLNPIFKDAFIDNNSLNIKDFKVGLQFYIM
ncbi:porin family protein [Lutibacter flavus]|uniref:Outer membrane protein beta-barrel domain-containing protein n=1 Tax=Lutibacter flavus TaxID=691689 RepID=A0A238YSG8_9FLAO|nr:porin family protein [Lutibacter flavus]SNR73768.1 Outer membrane protein beta-barrel domain-containing protein [Lutibacter flavus]